MAKEREARVILGRLERIKTWQLVVLLIIVGLLCATFLRLNNIGMVERRNAVMSADEQGDEAALRNGLFSLQRHAASHMNASSGTVYLEQSYKRDTERIVEEAKRGSSVADDAIERADEICRRQFPGYSQAYVQCNASEQAKIAGENPSAVVSFPSPELYRHEYSSPLWSPDFAGWTFLLCLAITGVIIVRLLLLLLLRLLLHKHYSNI